MVNGFQNQKELTMISLVEDIRRETPFAGVSLQSKCSENT